MIKLLELTARLFIAIKKQKWSKASEINEEIKTILDTYKIAC
jgi:hypothetical protein